MAPQLTVPQVNPFAPAAIAPVSVMPALDIVPELTTDVLVIALAANPPQLMEWVPHDMVPAAKIGPDTCRVQEGAEFATPIRRLAPSRNISVCSGFVNAPLTRDLKSQFAVAPVPATRSCALDGLPPGLSGSNCMSQKPPP
jgi:hypothetical protein